MATFGYDKINQKMFADQFEADSTGYIYRKSQRGAGIHVSLAERDTFVADFVRDQRRRNLLVAVGTVVLILAILVITTTIYSGPIEPLIFGGITAILVFAVLAWKRSWDAPARTLAGRPTVAGARTKGEVRRAMLTKMSWQQLTLPAVGFGFALYQISMRSSLLVGWHRLWVVAAVIFYGLLAWNAFRKWRLGSNNKR